MITLNMRDYHIHNQHCILQWNQRQRGTRKIGTSLQRLEEDPTFVLERNKETKQLLIADKEICN